MLEPQLQEILASQDFLSPWRQKAWEKFRDLGSLQFKQEAFRYVPVHDLELPKAAGVGALHIAKKESYRIVFIDGFFSLEDSHLPAGILCMTLQEAFESYGLFLQNRFSKAIQEETDPLAALNGAFHGAGAFVYIPAKKLVKEPIAIEYFSRSGLMATPRITVHAGKGSSVQLVQNFHSEENSCVNAYIDLSLDEEAQVLCKTVQHALSQGSFFQAWKVTGKRASSFTSRMYSEGAAVSRHCMKVQLLEQMSEALLQGVTCLKGKLHHHIHATVEHFAENTRSRQHFKSLLYDESCVSFEGKIFVHPEAQKTQSYQLNNTLLLGKLATSYAKPNLEILADDVKASHGATVAKLDPESLFYLRSRGLSLDEAMAYLTTSFVQELKECLP
jgi:Fe-S cluster assembly protein SufD